MKKIIKSIVVLFMLSILSLSVYAEENSIEFYNIHLDETNKTLMYTTENDDTYILSDLYEIGRAHV